MECQATRVWSVRLLEYGVRTTRVWSDRLLEYGESGY